MFVRLLKKLKDFATDRTQRVISKGQNSSWPYVKAGAS